MGDSIIRDVRSSRAVTHCFPGAKVNDILAELPSLLSQYTSIKKVVVHVGTNDLPQQQSELLKCDFMHLFKILKLSGKEVFISGPLPTVGRGGSRFSRLLQLHTWLQSQCCCLQFGFIDSVNLFWECYPLFKHDGLHPNRAGSRMLAANMSYSILSNSRVCAMDNNIQHPHARVYNPSTN